LQLHGIWKCVVPAELTTESQTINDSNIRYRSEDVFKIIHTGGERKKKAREVVFKKTA
jgi:hypothetical protein